VLVGPGLAPTISDSSILVGNGGAPGADGAGVNGGAISGWFGDQGAGTRGQTNYLNNKMNDGVPAEGGYSYGIFALDTAGTNPVVSNNSITVGTAGTRGYSGAQNF
jgi:hypothetical protein